MRHLKEEREREPWSPLLVAVTKAKLHSQIHAYSSSYIVTSFFRECLDT